MKSIKSEGADDVKDFLLKNIQADIRQQVCYIASDQPSAVMMDRLSEVLPSSEVM